MDIVSDIPFQLKLIHRFPTYREEVGAMFSQNEYSIWSGDFCTLSAEENDEIEILFDSEDENARLYLDALDIVPLDDATISEDENGRLFRKASPTSFVLYKNNDEYDALRVDTFKISVLCKGNWYYGIFDILPKPISKNEWKMMKDDLENEIHGLAQDIVRRNIGIGDYRSANIPPKIIYDFFVIKKYSNRVMMALVDIAENPRCQIQTEYENVLVMKSNGYRFDKETMRRYASTSGSEATMKVPIKKTSYDIQDNRLLKDMLNEYENKLTHFVCLIEEAEKYSNSSAFGSSTQYKNSWHQSLKDFKETANKLKKMTAILKSKEWFVYVGNLSEPHIPHSFIRDTRYNIIYQMHMELKRNTMNVQLNSEFSYTWKRSSYLYEMWCFLKTCRFFLEDYELDSSTWNFDFSGKILFPFLEEGTRVVFFNKKIRLELVYDQCLPLNNKKSDINNPLYIAENHSGYRNHNRPDIVINVYDKESEIYLGAIILECKYRKLNSFWNSSSPRSSRAQLEAYYNNARSTVLYNGLGETFDMRPVGKVLVLSPDEYAEGKKQEDFNIEIKTFKPSQDMLIDEVVKRTIFLEINNMENKYEKLKDVIRK